jgi:hypothetical protein
MQRPETRPDTKAESSQELRFTTSKRTLERDCCIIDAPHAQSFWWHVEVVVMVVERARVAE